MKKTILLLTISAALFSCKKTETVTPDKTTDLIGYYEGTFTVNGTQNNEKIEITKYNNDNITLKEYNSTTGNYDVLTTSTSIVKGTNVVMGNLNSTNYNGGTLQGRSVYLASDGNKYDFGYDLPTKKITIGLNIVKNGVTIPATIECTKK